MVFGLFKKKKKDKFLEDLKRYEKEYPSEEHRTDYNKDVLGRAFKTGVESPFSEPTRTEKPELHVEERFKGFLPKQEEKYAYIPKVPVSEREDMVLVRKDLEILNTKIDALKANFEVINNRLKNIEDKLKTKERYW